MFRATFLGWQGWILESTRTRLIADPLLLDEVGRGPAHTRTSFHFWPPRSLDLEQLPPADAIWISHEHEDHFNIPTLARIDRSVPLLLSSRVSTAAKTIAAEMGFTVRLVEPGETVTIGDLRLTAFTPNHLKSPPSDEWDTLGYLVVDEARSGGFFTNVDIIVTPEMIEAVSFAASSPSKMEILIYEAMALSLWSDQRTHASKSSEMHQAPRDGSFASGDGALRILCEGNRLLPRPGQTIALARSAVESVTDRTAYLATPDPPWPTRPSFWPDAGVENSEPRTQATGMSSENISEIELGLAELARFLYGRNLFKALHSRTRDGRRPNLVLVLWDGSEEAFTYEYRADACAFVALLESPDLDAYAGVVELWASDLLALLRGEIEPRTIVKNTRESWHGVHPGARLTFELWEFFHPLRHPERTLAQYRRTLCEQSSAPICIKHTGGE